MILLKGFVHFSILNSKLFKEDLTSANDPFPQNCLNVIYISMGATPLIKVTSVTCAFF
jgi:hypothetical protein